MRKGFVFLIVGTAFLFFSGKVSAVKFYPDNLNASSYSPSTVKIFQNCDAGGCDYSNQSIIEFSHFRGSGFPRYDGGWSPRLSSSCEPGCTDTHYVGQTFKPSETLEVTNKSAKVYKVSEARFLDFLFGQEGGFTGQQNVEVRLYKVVNGNPRGQLLETVTATACGFQSSVSPCTWSNVPNAGWLGVGSGSNSNGSAWTSWAGTSANLVVTFSNNVTRFLPGESAYVELRQLTNVNKNNILWMRMHKKNPGGNDNVNALVNPNGGYCSNGLGPTAEGNEPHPYTIDQRAPICSSEDDLAQFEIYGDAIDVNAATGTIRASDSSTFLDNKLTFYGQGNANERGLANGSIFITKRTGTGTLPVVSGSNTCGNDGSQCGQLPANCNTPCASNPSSPCKVNSYWCRIANPSNPAKNTEFSGEYTFTEAGTYIASVSIKPDPAYPNANECSGNPFLTYPTTQGGTTFNYCGTNSYTTVTASVNPPAQIPSLKIEDASNNSTFEGSSNTSGKAPTEGVGWANPMNIVLNASGGSKYYVAFYDKNSGAQLTSADTFISDLTGASGRLKTNSQNGFLLEYDVDGTFKVWDNCTNSMVNITTNTRGYEVKHCPTNSNTVIYTVTPAGALGWKIEFNKNFTSKNMYTAAYAETVAGLKTLEPDFTCPTSPTNRSNTVPYRTWVCNP